MIEDNRIEVIEKYVKIKSYSTICSIFSIFFIIVLIIGILGVCNVFVEKIDIKKINPDMLNDLVNNHIIKDGVNYYSSYVSYVVKIIAFVVFGFLYIFWLIFSIKLVLIIDHLPTNKNYLYKYSILNYFIFFIASGIILGTATAIINEFEFRNIETKYAQHFEEI